MSFHHEIMSTEIFDPIWLRCCGFFLFLIDHPFLLGEKKRFFAIVICHHITPSCLKIPIQPLFFFALAAQLSKLLKNKAKNSNGAHKSHCNNSLPSDTGETGSPSSGQAFGKWFNFYLSKTVVFIFDRLEARQISLVSYLLSLNMCPCRC